MDGIYKNIEEYNLNKEIKILIIFDYLIADMLSNKNFNPIVTELFNRERKLIISLVFITQSYLAVPKNIRLNSTHYFVMNESFIRYWFSKLYESLKNMYLKTIFFFGYWNYSCIR